MEKGDIETRTTIKVDLLEREDGSTKARTMISGSHSEILGSLEAIMVALLQNGSFPRETIELVLDNAVAEFKGEERREE